MANRRGKSWKQWHIFLSSQITEDSDCIHEIKRCLLAPWKKNYDQPKQRSKIILPIKLHIVKVLIFPVVMCRCECWTIKNAEHQRIDAFQLSCWRSLLRVPWTPKRSNQSILKEIDTECLLEGLILKLKLQFFGCPTHWKRPWCWERLKAKGEGGRRGWLHSITNSMDMNLSKFQETVEDRGAWRAAVHGVAKCQTWLSNWTTTNN